MAQAVQENTREAAEAVDGPSAGAATSMFAVEPPKPRSYQKHDLIQIVVRETTTVNKKSKLDATKDWEIKASVKQFPDLSLEDLLNFQVQAGGVTGLPELDVSAERDFEGDGEQKQQEDVTARVTAEVVEVLPNGNLVLEGRTFIKVDDEESEIRITGTGRPDDVTLNNTILSTQLHELRWERVTKGELKRTTKKGLVSRVLETIFNF
jgi:flagellar L-ring protein precursor FlgH